LILHEKFPTSNSIEMRAYRNPYYALGAALRLDRIKQWTEILEASQLRENTLFFLHGHRDQSVGLFLERIQRFFSQEQARPRQIYRVSFNIQGQKPTNGSDWMAHIRDALQTSNSLAAELRQLVQKQPIFLLLGQNPLPLDKLEREYLDAIRELITERLPSLLQQPGLHSGVGIMLAVDYAAEQPGLLSECERWGVQAETTGTMRFRPLPRVLLPSWDEVQSYLDVQIRPRPSQDDIILIRKKYDQLADKDPELGFDKLARLIDAMTLNA
jgi:inactive STAND